MNVFIHPDTMFLRPPNSAANPIFAHRSADMNAARNAGGSVCPAA